MDPTDRLPATGAGFVWETEPVPVLRPSTSAASAAFTTRVGGRSEGPYASLDLSFVVGDDEQTVRENRVIAGAAVGAGAWTVTRQVHGCEVVAAERAGLDPRNADGLFTADPSQTLAVLSADCVLLLLCGPGGVAVAHAGWRGLLAGVVENAVASIGATEVFAGPAIGPCCFEVGPEVVEAFADRAPAAVVDARHIDLWSAAEHLAGAAAFHAARICTACHPDLFFSHRRDRGRTGRQALLARPVSTGGEA
jgi:YfiH family protein